MPEQEQNINYIRYRFDGLRCSFRSSPIWDENELVHQSTGNYTFPKEDFNYDTEFLSSSSSDDDNFLI